MRNLFTAMLVALVTFLFSAQGVAAQYPVVKEFGDLDFTEYFVNGASPIGNTDLEVNCRPSEEERDSLFFRIRDDGLGYISTRTLFSSGEQQRIINRYFSCIGLRQLEEPERFGCASIKTLFRYLEMFQPNHPSPDRAQWSEMDQKLYYALYELGWTIKKDDEEGYMARIHGGHWTLCKELW